MIEYIPDLREVERIPGLNIPARLADAPVPGFMDQFGNYVAVGDWVTMGANQGRCAGGLRLAQVLKVAPKETTVHAGYEPIPEAEWGPYLRDMAAKGQVPQRSVYAPGPLTVELEVRFYFDARPDSRSRRHAPRLDQVARYQGEVPYLR